VSARHARQLVLVGDLGQARLAAAAVVVDGDGLGSEVAALYLAGAGVGRVDVAPSLVANVRAQDPEVVVTSARARADARLALHVDAGGVDARGGPTLGAPHAAGGAGSSRDVFVGALEDPLGDPVGLGAELARRALLAILGLGGAS
jgi:hypothetical protein